MTDNHFITVSRDGILWARRKGCAPLAIADGEAGLAIEPEPPRPSAAALPGAALVHFGPGGANRELFVTAVSVGAQRLPVAEFQAAHGVDDDTLGAWMRAAVERRLDAIEAFEDARAIEEPRAREVLAILERGAYDGPDGGEVAIGRTQFAAETRTRLYTPATLAAWLERTAAGTGAPPSIDVLPATTLEAAQRLGGAMVILNFASARNPGGGFPGGAKAQEEELCRCGGLYRTLLRAPGYYHANRAWRSALYTDHAIHSPEVPFFRIAADAPLLAAPMLLSVITAPAPNAGAIHRNHPADAAAIRPTFLRRWTAVLAIAAHHHHRRLVLGAWGCGAFRNDPQLAAETAREALALPRFAGAFDAIVFAIPSRGEVSSQNLAAFRRVFTAGG